MRLLLLTFKSVQHDHQESKWDVWRNKVINNDCRIILPQYKAVAEQWLFFLISLVKRLKKKNTKTVERTGRRKWHQTHIHQSIFGLSQMWLRGGFLTVSKTLRNKRLFNLAKQVSRSWSQKFKLNMWQILSVGRWLTTGTNCQEKQVIFPSHEIVKLELNNSGNYLTLAKNKLLVSVHC